MFIKSQLITILLLSLFSHLAQAQEIVGFWEIEKVTVGNQTMTPVAKWTRINSDRTYQSGNGWLQNSTGTWIYNESEKTYVPTETNGLKDEYGAFKVSFPDNRMQWQRMEDGMQVVVTLSRIEKMPKSTADKITGLWNLIKTTNRDQEEGSSIHSHGKHYLFLRWDRIFIKGTSDSKQTGYWHMNGHRPELTLLSYNEKESPSQWKVEITSDTLKLFGQSDNNRSVLTYKRIDEFPE